MTPGNAGIKNRRRWIPAAATVLAVTAIGTGFAAAPAWAVPPIPQSGTLTWSIMSSDASPSGQTPAAASPESMIVEFSPDVLEHPVDSVFAEIEGQVPAGTTAKVDVRGLNADGSWTDWTAITPDASAALPSATSSVQTRLVLTAEGAVNPDINQIDLTGWDSAQIA